MKIEQVRAMAKSYGISPGKGTVIGLFHVTC